MDLYAYSKDVFEGPGGLISEYREMRLGQNMLEIKEGLIDFRLVWNSLKRSRALNIGSIVSNEYFGPFIRNELHPEDFKEINGDKPEEVISDFIDRIPAFYFKAEHGVIDRNACKDKIDFSMRMIPRDKTTFYVFNHSFYIKPDKNEKMVEHTDIDYFFSMVGFNNDRVYLIIVWYA